MPPATETQQENGRQVSIPDLIPSSPPRRKFSISVRELLMVIAIVALLLTIFFQQPGTKPIPNSPNALYSIDQPVRFRFWHQRADRGAGVIDGWSSADGLSFYDDYIIAHHQDGGQLIPREHLTHFSWVLDETKNQTGTGNPGSAAPH